MPDGNGQELEVLLRVNPTELDKIEVAKDGQKSLERIRNQLTSKDRPDISIMKDWARVGRHGKTGGDRAKDIAAGMGVVLGNEHYISVMEWRRDLKEYKRQKKKWEKVLDLKKENAPPEIADRLDDLKKEAAERIISLRDDIAMAMAGISEASEHINNCCKVIMQSEGTLAALPNDQAAPVNTPTFQPGQRVGPGGTMVVAKEAHFHPASQTQLPAA
jgi:hypothetical protein